MSHRNWTSQRNERPIELLARWTGRAWRKANGKPKMHAGHVLLLLLIAGVRGDATCTNGAVTGGAVGAVNTNCECNKGYAGGGAVFRLPGAVGRRAAGCYNEPGHWRSPVHVTAGLLVLDDARHLGGRHDRRGYILIRYFEVFA